MSWLPLIIIMTILCVFLWTKKKKLIGGSLLILFVLLFSFMWMLFSVYSVIHWWFDPPKHFVSSPPTHTAENQSHLVGLFTKRGVPYTLREKWVIDETRNWWPNNFSSPSSTVQNKHKMYTGNRVENKKGNQQKESKRNRTSNLELFLGLFLSFFFFVFSPLVRLVSLL